ncbi:MAG: thioredoxin domain-containing protein, partial [Alphaproteobacteria bacterium]|nr:thioredoxin domain-containing protein [Alphaproteobacteria bacterium]
LMNQEFINIKVDREERPDLDAIYQRALGIMGQHGGWPLTMFLAPGGEPFWGGTYFPKVSGFGRPSFTEVLTSISRAYQDEPEKIQGNREAILKALNGLGDSAPGEPLTTLDADALTQLLLNEIDSRNGGIGGAPKFPQCSMLDLMWRHYRRNGSPEMRDAVVLTADRMSQGGIYDHVGGGYARYATDERWLVPHFEKMLYDNAQLLELLTHLWLETGNELFRRRATETTAWMLREMRTPEDAFASALDADSEGVEGKYYVWSADDINSLLGDDADHFSKIYDVTQSGNWESTNILNRLLPPPDSTDPDEDRLSRCLTTLLDVRDKRIRPEWDDKVLTDWNGLAIAALATAGRVFDQTTWLNAAVTAFAYITSKMSNGDRLRHASRAGVCKTDEFLDDYAQMSRAALTLFEITGDSSYLDHASRWAQVLDDYYWDTDQGGYFFTPADGATLVTRAKLSHDSATPAGNGTMVSVLARLYHLTGDPAYRERAQELVRSFSGQGKDRYAPIASTLAGIEDLVSSVQIIIIGVRGDTDCDALTNAVFSVSLPSRILQIVASGADLPVTHPAHGKTRVKGVAAAYVCIGEACNLPITDPATLKLTLTSPIDQQAGSVPPASVQ